MDATLLSVLSFIGLIIFNGVPLVESNRCCTL